MKFHWWGSQGFAELEQMQHKICQGVFSGDEEVVLGGEHPAIITLGRRAQSSEVLSSVLPVHQCARGGLATLHSPGQLVIYPILNLRKRNWGVRLYVEALLKTTQKTLLEFGLETKCDSTGNPGLYTKIGKIAFCGLKIVQGVSMYGLSINIGNDLSLFKNLRPCGISGQSLDRLQNHLADPLDLEVFFEAWGTHWGSQVQEVCR
jgi:lipoyl(octanoyl) transferase